MYGLFEDVKLYGVYESQELEAHLSRPRGRDE